MVEQEEGEGQQLCLDSRLLGGTLTAPTTAHSHLPTICWGGKLNRLLTLFAEADPSFCEDTRMLHSRSQTWCGICSNTHPASVSTKLGVVCVAAVSGLPWLLSWKSSQLLAGSWFWQAQLAGSWFWQLLPLAGLFCPFPTLGLAPTSSTWVKTQTHKKNYTAQTHDCEMGFWTHFWGWGVWTF